MFLVLFAVTVGSVSIPIEHVWKILLNKLPLVSFGQTWTEGEQIIIWDIRLPRVLLAGAIGMALSVAGATYQGLFRNPLADAYLIGVAQGAALGAVIGFVMPITGVAANYGIVPILAFCGALLAVVVVYSLARVGRTLPVSTLILAGVALGALLGAIVSYLTLSGGQSVRGILFWLAGSLAMVKWSEFWIVFPVALLGSIVIMLFGRPLNIMQMDENQAQQLGVNVERVKVSLLVVSTLITAVSVAFVGIIGFVGIIIPHMVRLVWGADYRFLLPLSMICGAIFLIVADLLARTLMPPTEIPIGVITALAGAPFFLYLLKRKAKMLF